MCLRKVSQKKLKSTGFGWKVFYERNGKLYGEFYGMLKSRPLGKWLNEKKYRRIFRRKFIKTYGYLAGWHIFKKKKDAKFWCDSCGQMVVYKVEYRGVHAQGYQAGSMCVVAKKIKILPRKGGIK